MDRRRVAGVGVLAAAVIALSVGTGLSRPLIVGAASAPPVAPPPQVGDCLYGGPEGPWPWSGADGTEGDHHWERVAYTRWYEACGDPWFAEVAGVRVQADVDQEVNDAATSTGVDPCAAVTAAFLGRPEVPGVAGWMPVTAGGFGLEPDRRQLASGQGWLACVVGPPAWGPDGQLVDAEGTAGARTTESMRNRWDDLTVRDRLGVCETGPAAAATGTFCGVPHDREYLAYYTWPERPDAATLIEGCRKQAADLMQRDSVGGALSVEIVLYGADGAPEIVTAQTELPDYGGANCTIRAAEPAAQLTATVVGLVDRPDPVTGG